MLSLIEKEYSVDRAASWPKVLNLKMPVTMIAAKLRQLIIPKQQFPTMRDFILYAPAIRTAEFNVKRRVTIKKNM